MRPQVSVARTPEGGAVTRVITDEHFDLPYEALLASAEPKNWSVILPRRFLRMIDLGLDQEGFHRYIEHGKYSWWKSRTPLRFWKWLREPGYQIDYELDPRRDDRRNLVSHDSGYIAVMPDGDGVRVRTSKDWALNGLGAHLGALITPSLGWSEITEEFFTNAAVIATEHPERLTPFTPSAPPLWSKL